jgi:hypothetical protein
MKKRKKKTIQKEGNAGHCEWVATIPPANKK